MYFPCKYSELIQDATNVRLKSASVITVCLDLDPVPFNKGFYSIDMTFFFRICLDVYGPPASGPTTVNGVSIFTKRVILYGSEGNVKMFSSDAPKCNPRGHGNSSLVPKATVQIAEPIGLSAKICDTPSGGDCYRIPEEISDLFGGELDFNASRTVYVTLGIFTIVQIVRNVQLLIPAYDFCIPDKECVTSSDDPCATFQRIEFPTDEFFPPKITDCSSGDRGNKAR